MGLFEEIKARQGIEPPPDPDPAERVELAAPETLVANFPQVIEPDPDGITRRFMDSKVLGAVVPIAWTPDGGPVWVEGTPYTAKEVGELMARRPDAETMRTVHQVKQTFTGTLN